MYFSTLEQIDVCIGTQIIINKFIYRYYATLVMIFHRFLGIIISSTKDHQRTYMPIKNTLNRL